MSHKGKGKMWYSGWFQVSQLGHSQPWTDLFTGKGPVSSPLYDKMRWGFCPLARLGPVCSLYGSSLGVAVSFKRRWYIHMTWHPDWLLVLSMMVGFIIQDDIFAVGDWAKLDFQVAEKSCGQKKRGRDSGSADHWKIFPSSFKEAGFWTSFCFNMKLYWVFFYFSKTVLSSNIL